jgi:hypothetical protein
MIANVRTGEALPGCSRLASNWRQLDRVGLSRTGAAERAAAEAGCTAFCCNSSNTGKRGFVLVPKRWYLGPSWPLSNQRVSERVKAGRAGLRGDHPLRRTTN